MYLTTEPSCPRTSNETTILLNSHWRDPCVRDEKEYRKTCNHKLSPFCLWVWAERHVQRNPGQYVGDSGVLGRKRRDVGQRQWFSLFVSHESYL